MGLDFVGEAALAQLRSALETKAGSGENFIRYCRKRLQIRTVDAKLAPFVLRPIQRRYLAAKRLARMQGRPPRYLLLKYRRGGYTTLEQALSYYQVTHHRHTSVLTLAYDKETTARIFRIAHLFHQHDAHAPPIKGVGNKYQLDFPGLNSMFYVGTAGARGASRGDTLQRVHWSEVAFSCQGPNQVEDQRKLLTGMAEAASHGEMVLETTPNGSELFRELYLEAKEGRNEWVPIFLPWMTDPTNAMPGEPLGELSDDEARLRERHQLTDDQIRWRRQKLVSLKHLFYQEYPEDDETCWLMTGTPYFDQRMVLDLRDRCQGPEMVLDHVQGYLPEGAKPIPGGWLIEYAPPRAGGQYCLGVDTSEGLVGCDYGGIGVLDRDTGAQVCSVHGLFRPRELAELVCQVARRYNDALIGIERQNHGHAVIQKVMDLGITLAHDRGGQLYHHVAGREARQGEKQVAKAGWSTDAVTRPVMLNALREWLEAPDPLARVFDRHFLSECLTFRLQADGGFAADPGAHDDSVIKWAIANQMRAVPWSTGGYETEASRYS